MVELKPPQLKYLEKDYNINLWKLQSRTHT